MIKTSDCVFCLDTKDKKDNTYILHEAKDHYLILDIFPIELAHILVITKDHYKNYLEVNTEILNNMNITIKKIVRLLKNKLNIQGYNLTTNSEKCAGQEIFHFHWHIIPRYDINHTCLSTPRKKLSRSDFINLKNKLNF